MAKRSEQPARPEVATDRARTEQTEQEGLYSLVVIGSSAGGIEALSTVLGSLAPDFPIPIVVAQHLDPRHPSHLGEILTRHSALKVHTVADHEPLEPGVVYVVPADRHVEISDGHLGLLSDELPRPKPSINLLLSSAARTHGERLIAVILTGTGSDGAAGAREVKANGGTVVIENPETAAYPGMPASLAPTTVDFVANLDQIGPLLRDLVAGTSLAALSALDGTEEVDAEAGEHEQSLQTVLAHVRERSGIDFSSYKRPTILRRLQRRIVATNVSDLPAYSQYLTSHPDEYQRLTASFLIKVTEFFRDPDLFDVLRERVLPDLIAHARAHDNVLRIWSAGCATGEEAYSLAILVAETLGEELEQFQVLIFATDLDDEAVAFARRGIYPGTALVGLPEELVARYFTRLDGIVEVTKQLRGLVIFGQHDLGQRPPFPHIDLVLCRNVLIYFTKELQARALQLFAFALRDGGYLALGKAETARPLDAYFAPIQGPLKLYRRQGERVLGPIVASMDAKGLVPRLPAPESRDRRRPLPPGDTPRADQMRTFPAQVFRALAAGERPRTTGEWLGNLVLGLPLGVVVVDRRYDIQAINSTALRLLGIYTAPQGEDLIHLTRSIPVDGLRSAIDAAFQRRATPGSRDQARGRFADRPGAEAVVTLETVLGERRFLHITCYPFPAPPKAEGVVGETGEAHASEEMTPRRTPDVESVLLLIDDATSVVSEQQNANETAQRQQGDERARAAREQGNREQAARLAQEENERLKAEMERIGTINRSLLEANQDLTDTVLELRRTNEELLVGHEEAQANAEEVKTLNEELQATNEELVTINEEMEATVEELHTSNDDLQARGRELQQSSEALAAERATAEAKREQLAAILVSLGDAVLVVDRAGTVILTNAAYDELFGGASVPLAAEDEVGRLLPSAATPQRRAARGESFTMEFILTAQDGTRRWFEATGKPIGDADDGVGGVVAIRDITERSLHRLEDEFLALASHELRTPLTPLNAYLQLLSRQFADQAEDALARRYIERAQQQVRRLKRLVLDLLDVRRLQGGGFQLETERVALDQVAERSVETAETMIADVTDQTIHLVHPDTPVFVEGDVLRLEQVLLNLLTNAITYAPNSARIDVRLRRVGSEAEIQVQDYGVGIPATALPQIFSRFYQVARTDADRPSRRGLGLGLYIVQELVAAHGGRIEVASVEAPREGHGTTFTIRLPLAPDGTTESPRKEPG